MAFFTKVSNTPDAAASPKLDEPLNRIPARRYSISNAIWGPRERVSVFAYTLNWFPKNSGVFDRLPEEDEFGNLVIGGEGILVEENYFI
jgi:hypothetical protein